MFRFCILLSLHKVIKGILFVFQVLLIRSIQLVFNSSYCLVNLSKTFCSIFLWWFRNIYVYLSHYLLPSGLTSALNVPNLQVSSTAVFCILIFASLPLALVSIFSVEEFIVKGPSCEDDPESIGKFFKNIVTIAFPCKFLKSGKNLLSLNIY